MHRYQVIYIAREGHVDAISVFAANKSEARETAERNGCEDILKVRRIGWPVLPVISVLIILAGVMFLVLR